MKGKTVLVLGADDHGRRADRIIRKALPSLSLSLIYRLFREGKVTCRSKRLSIHDRCASGDEIEIDIPKDDIPRDTLKENAGGAPYASKVPILTPGIIAGEQPYIAWQNEHLRAVYKPAGMLTHDGSASLDAWLRSHPDNNRPPSASFVPGPLHRLDRNTSGIIMFSRSRLGAELFSAALRSRRVGKRYLALCEGEITEPLFLRDLMERDRYEHVSRIQHGGRMAAMDLFPLIARNGLTLAAIDLKTGLTHQIRAQAAAHGHPLAGDRKYGASVIQGLGTYLLHAASLSVKPPLFDDMPEMIAAPLPHRFLSAVSKFLEADIDDVREKIASATESA